MDLATDAEFVAEFVSEVLSGTGWNVDRIRPRGSRLDPPDSFWSAFAVHINKDGEERDLRLIAKGALNDGAWERLKARLAADASRDCDPINGIGYPRLFDESRHAYWFYPYDPAMPGLHQAADPVFMAGVLTGVQDGAAGAPRVEVQRVRYMPEQTAILRYTMKAAGSPVKVFGKLQPGHRGLRTFRIVEGLWQAAARYPGFLNLPRPLGYIEEMGLLLEESVRGKAVSGNRMSTQFGMAANAAAEALAVIHEAGIPADETIRIDDELARLDRVAEQFTYVLPSGHFLLRDLIDHMRDRIRKTEQEDVLPTHGDMKYDQFLFHNDVYTLLDFDYYAMAETSYDLGKCCAYIFPSTPETWRHSVRAEELRELFIRRYRELRPDATLQRFGVYEALQFALRAMSFMWAQTHGWERIAETLLVLGFERLKTRFPA